MGPIRTRAGNFGCQLASPSRTIVGGLPIPSRGPRRPWGGQTIPFRETVSRPASTLSLCAFWARKCWEEDLASAPKVRPGHCLPIEGRPPLGLNAPEPLNIDRFWNLLLDSRMPSLHNEGRL
jgi:hypothetical protein